VRLSTRRQFSTVSNAKQYFDFPSTPIRRWPPQSGLAETCKLLIKYGIIAGIISFARR
jgi:hypothetical protein